MPPEHCWTLGLVENLTPVGTNQIIKHIDGFLKFDSKNHKSVNIIAILDGLDFREIQNTGF